MIVVQRLVLGFTCHWLLMLNGLVIVYLGGAYLAPVLMETRHPLAANVVYMLYGMTCYQLPQRSYFFFGNRGVLFTLSHLDPFRLDQRGIEQGLHHDAVLLCFLLKGTQLLLRRLGRVDLEPNADLLEADGNLL